MPITQSTKAELNRALRLVRQAEREAQRATDRGDVQACYAALERCQHAAFDARSILGSMSSR